MNADSRTNANVIALRTPRARQNRINTMTLIFGGVHYGTFPVGAAYTEGTLFRLFVLAEDGSDGPFAGPVDVLVTDEADLTADADIHVAW